MKKKIDDLCIFIIDDDPFVLRMLQAGLEASYQVKDIIASNDVIGVSRF